MEKDYTPWVLVSIIALVALVAIFGLFRASMGSSDNFSPNFVKTAENIPDSLVGKAYGILADASAGKQLSDKANTTK